MASSSLTFLFCLLSLLGTFFLQGVQSQTNPNSAALPDVITVKRYNLQSKDFVHNPFENYFLISSLVVGSVYKVHYNENIETWLPGSTAYMMMSSSGLKLDYGRGLVHVANGRFPPEYTPDHIQASYIKVNLSNNVPLLWVNLSAIGNQSKQHAANDLDLDEEGNVYITDSYGGQIWVVNDTTGVAEVLVTNPAFDATDGKSIGLNGILYHENGYLICSKSGSSGRSKMFRIDVATKNVTQITIGGLLVGADGIDFDPSSKNILYMAGEGYLYTIETSDEWMTASVKQKIKVPSACSTPLAIQAIRPGKVYAFCQQADGYESIMYVQTTDSPSPWWWYFVIVIGFVVLTVACLTPYWLKKCGCGRIKLPTTRVKDAHVELQEMEHDPDASKSNRDMKGPPPVDQ